MSASPQRVPDGRDEAARGGTGRSAELMSIGEVLAHLRGEFPDVTISKLRFLEAEGLVEPRRTPSGYRKYTWSDVARLRFVLTAQRDHYLPLRVIREQLVALDRGEAAAEVTREVLKTTAAPGERPVLAALPDPHRPAPAAPVPPETPVRLDRAQLLASSGLTDEVLTELERQGMVRASGGCYDVDALTVARVVAQLGEYGLGPRHLRGYRAAADREVGLFAQLVSPLARQRTPAARDRAAELVRELVALSQQLHAALVRVGLRDTLG